MKKLGKNLNLVERTVEAYGCTSCSCSGCPCSCSTSSALNVASTNGVQSNISYDVGQDLTPYYA